MQKWLIIILGVILLVGILFYFKYSRITRLIIYFIPQLLFALSPQPSDHEYLIPLCF
jgi:hypothetical protein